MEDLLVQSDVLYFRGVRPEEPARLAATVLGSVPGVFSAAAEGNRVRVEYHPEIVSFSNLAGCLREAGLEPETETQVPKKGFFARFVERLGTSNGKTFGSGKLDCCTMNGPKKQPEAPPDTPSAP